jgi:hypothetical protein
MEVVMPQETLTLINTSEATAAPSVPTESKVLGRPMVFSDELISELRRRHGEDVRLEGTTQVLDRIIGTHFGEKVLSLMKDNAEKESFAYNRFARAYNRFARAYNRFSR